MTTHTPGPWKSLKLDGFTYINPQRESGEYALIAKIVGGKEGNARLIASAPDLLAALESLFEHCSMVHNQWGDGSNQQQADAAIAAGRAAIAKATGA